VLSTVHTNDAVSAVARLRDIGVAPYLISASLLAVVGQRLCRMICPDCIGPDVPAPQLVRAIGLDPDVLDFEPKRGKGCRRCIGTGYIGRIGIFELFEISDASTQHIVQLDSSDQLRKTARSEGMRTLVEDALEKVRGGRTTVEEVARVAGCAY
jgi:type II secretory ATPase GspE/PulE/Tfp pilus assembly ATPase PilB-like protein